MSGESADEPGDALAKALAMRADLEAVRDATRISESRKRLAVGSFGPRLALEGNVLWNRAPSVSGSLETHELAVTLRLPLFDGLGRLHAVREAEANLAAAREREKGRSWRSPRRSSRPWDASKRRELSSGRARRSGTSGKKSPGSSA